jgi:hypothetical protein
MLSRAAKGWSGMATFRSVRCPPGLGRCASRCPRCESAVAPGCACTRRSGPPRYGGRKVSRRCCPGSPGQASRRGRAPRPSRPAWGQRHRVWPQRRSGGCNRAGTQHCRRGKAAASRANGLSRAGATAWTARPALQQRALVSSSVLVRRRATRKTAGSPSTGAAWSTGQGWPVAMARWGCGRRSTTSMSRPVGYGGGGRRPPVGETHGRRPSSRRPNNTSRRSGGCPTASGRSWRWTSSRRPTS